MLIDAERIEKLFIEEEKELTLSRPNLDTNEFLNLAIDFDKRVELERVNQRNKEAVINENLKFRGMAGLSEIFEPIDFLHGLEKRGLKIEIFEGDNVDV